MTDHFPFGAALEPRKPFAPAACRVFLLGASPGALHVSWTPPDPFRPVAALAVDNEPQPFWTGKDEAERIEAWAKQVGWQEAWGTVGPAGPFNGSSGQWLDQKVLSPLKSSRAETWMTDCVDTYRFTFGQQEVVTERFAPFAQKLGLPWAGVPDSMKHVDEEQLAWETRERHAKRLMNELRAAQPKLVVTLGNVALRVFAGLADLSTPEALEPNEAYGKELGATVGGKAVTWLPLIHPGMRSKEWQAVHAKWIRARTRPAGK